jgi:hypothetical protein
MNTKIIVGSVLITRHEKLMSGCADDLPFFLWKTAAAKWHASDVLIFVASLEQFAAIVDCLAALAPGEFLVAQVQHWVSFVAFQHATVTDESLVIAFHASVRRVWCAYTQVSV